MGWEKLSLQFHTSGWSFICITTLQTGGFKFKSTSRLNVCCNFIDQNQTPTMQLVGKSCQKKVQIAIINKKKLHSFVLGGLIIPQSWPFRFLCKNLHFCKKRRELAIVWMLLATTPQWINKPAFFLCFSNPLKLLKLVRLSPHIISWVNNTRFCVYIF